MEGALSGMPAGAGALLKEVKDLLDRLKDKESREKAVDQGFVVLISRVRFCRLSNRCRSDLGENPWERCQEGVGACRHEGQTA